MTEYLVIKYHRTKRGWLHYADADTLYENQKDALETARVQMSNGAERVTVTEQTVILDLLDKATPK